MHCILVMYCNACWRYCNVVRLWIALQCAHKPGCISFVCRNAFPLHVQFIARSLQNSPNSATMCRPIWDLFKANIHVCSVPYRRWFRLAERVDSSSISNVWFLQSWCSALPSVWGNSRWCPPPTTRLPCHHNSTLLLQLHMSNVIRSWNVHIVSFLHPGSRRSIRAIRVPITLVNALASGFLLCSYGG